MCWTECDRKCGGCKAVYFCSEECIRAGWSMHRLWCNAVVCGREKRDWNVVDLDTGRKGVVALRAFAQDEKIMIERMFSLEEVLSNDSRRDAMIRHLGPADGDFEMKYNLNAVGKCDDRGHFNGVCFRMAHVGHACEPSAESHFDPESRHMVLYAARPLAQGEAITISFTDFFNPNVVEMAYEQHALKLSLYGIVCGPDCACGKALDSKAVRSRMLERRLWSATQVVHVRRLARELVRLHSQDAAIVQFWLRLRIHRLCEVKGVWFGNEFGLHALASTVLRPGSAELRELVGL